MFENSNRLKFNLHITNYYFKREKIRDLNHYLKFRNVNSSLTNKARRFIEYSKFIFRLNNLKTVHYETINGS